MIQKEIGDLEQFLRDDFERIIQDGIAEYWRRQDNLGYVLHTDGYLKENIVYRTSDF